MPHGKKKQLMTAGKVSYACELCDKAYFSEYAIKLHFKKSHPNFSPGSGADSFMCPLVV